MAEPVDFSSSVTEEEKQLAADSAKEFENVCQLIVTRNKYPQKIFSACLFYTIAM